MTMTIPFLSYFKKVKDQAMARKERPVAAPNQVAPLEKPSSERFSKTVMPNATRTPPSNDQLGTAERSSTMDGQVPGSSGVATASSNSRTISFGAPAAAAARPRDLPPALALALEPRVERVISLELADIAEQIPADYIKPLESIDGTRRILLNASEVERGMASGKPAIALAAIYQQVPEIFLCSVAATDDAQVQLPFKKVLKQFTSLQVRHDQELQQRVPQVETPFLQVTLEDNSRFGTTTIEPAASEVGDLPPVRIELATAEALAAAEPEANGFVRQPTSEGTSAPPTRITARLSPNGTGGPAPESVPASSGPSVPTSLPSSQIPFKITAPSDDLRPTDEPWLTAENLAASAEHVPSAIAADSEVKISLSLKPILKALPPFQLSGDPDSLPEEALIELSFSLIEPQLATGRITLTPAVFKAALPAQYRDLFQDGDQPTDIILPLHDVLKNLPVRSLRMRDDQEEQEMGSNLATPFSAKAEEDAKRFNVAELAPANPVAAPTMADVHPQPNVAPARKPFDLQAPAPAEAPLEADERLDAKVVVAHLGTLEGVRACALTFGDGLSLAGSLPAEYKTDGLCAMAHSLVQRIESHVVETQLGALGSMTLSCTKGAISFFVHENLCLAALHASDELPTEVREEFARVVHELSRKYSHPV